MFLFQNPSTSAIKPTNPQKNRLVEELRRSWSLDGMFFIGIQFFGNSISITSSFHHHHRIGLVFVALEEIQLHESKLFYFPVFSTQIYDIVFVESYFIELIVGIRSGTQEPKPPKITCPLRIVRLWWSRIRPD